MLLINDDKAFICPPKPDFDKETAEFYKPHDPYYRYKNTRGKVTRSFKQQLGKVLDILHALPFCSAGDKIYIGIFQDEFLEKEQHLSVFVGQSPQFFADIKKMLEVITIQLKKETVLIDKKGFMKTLCEGLAKCGPGVFNHVLNHYQRVTGEDTICYWLAEFRTHLVTQYAERHIAKYKIPDSDSNHTRIRFQQTAKKEGFGLLDEAHIESINDYTFSKLARVNEYDEQRFVCLFITQLYTTSAMIDCIADRGLLLLKSSIKPFLSKKDIGYLDISGENYAKLITALARFNAQFPIALDALFKPQTEKEEEHGLLQSHPLLEANFKALACATLIKTDVLTSGEETLLLSFSIKENIKGTINKQKLSLHEVIVDEQKHQWIAIIQNNKTQLKPVAGWLLEAEYFYRKREKKEPLKDFEQDIAFHYSKITKRLSATTITSFIVTTGRLPVGVSIDAYLNSINTLDEIIAFLSIKNNPRLSLTLQQKDILQTKFVSLTFDRAKQQPAFTFQKVLPFLTAKVLETTIPNKSYSLAKFFMERMPVADIVDWLIESSFSAEDTNNATSNIYFSLYPHIDAITAIRYLQETGTWPPFTDFESWLDSIQHLGELLAVYNRIKSDKNLHSILVDERFKAKFIALAFREKINSIPDFVRRTQSILLNHIDLKTRLTVGPYQNKTISEIVLPYISAETITSYIAMYHKFPPFISFNDYLAKIITIDDWLILAELQHNHPFLQSGFDSPDCQIKLIELARQTPDEKQQAVFDKISHHLTVEHLIWSSSLDAPCLASVFFPHITTISLAKWLFSVRNHAEIDSFNELCAHLTIEQVTCYLSDYGVLPLGMTFRQYLDKIKTIDDFLAMHNAGQKNHLYKTYIGNLNYQANFIKFSLNAFLASRNSHQAINALCKKIGPFLTNETINRVGRQLLCYRGLSLAFVLASCQQGLTQLENFDLTADCLNSVIPNSPFKGQSVAYALLQTTQGIQYLNRRSILLDSINANTFCQLPEPKKENLVLQLATTEEGLQILLTHAALRSLITDEVMNKSVIYKGIEYPRLSFLLCEKEEKITTTKKHQSAPSAKPSKIRKAPAVKQRQFLPPETYRDLYSSNPTSTAFFEPEISNTHPRKRQRIVSFESNTHSSATRR